MNRQPRAVAMLIVVATTLTGCDKIGWGGDPYAKRETGSSADVAPSRLADYKALEACEYEIAELQGVDRPDGDADRKRRALEANANTNSLADCRAGLGRLKGAGR